MFPNVRKYPNGGYSNSTQIKNYPVQGFATADLLPVALVVLSKKIKENGLKSLICNTVHDSIVMDVHPDEEEISIRLMKEAMLSLKDECSLRFGVDYNIPVGIELKIGSNWSDLTEVGTYERT
jgi:DNA polymerase I-like protein with 3'-5' exonuclease and polymerase domains